MSGNPQCVRDLIDGKPCVEAQERSISCSVLMAAVSMAEKHSGCYCTMASGLQEHSGPEQAHRSTLVASTCCDSSTATICGRASCIRELSCARADVEGSTRDGKSPLMLAAQKGLVATLKELLEAKADPTLGTRAVSPRWRQPRQWGRMRALLSCWLRVQRWMRGIPRDRLRWVCRVGGSQSCLGTAAFGWS